MELRDQDWLAERLVNLLYLRDGQTVSEIYSLVKNEGVSMLQVFELLEDLQAQGFLTQKYNRYYLG